MKEHSYLIFSLNSIVYAISTIYVEEIFSPPELTPIPKASGDIVGVVNLRGDILQVVDLNLSFGYQSPDYCLTDSIVVLKWKELRLGIIVNEVHEQRNIFPEEIIIDFSHDQELAGVEQKEIIAGFVKNSGNILILIDRDNLFLHLEKQRFASGSNSFQNEITASKNTDIFPSYRSEFLLNKPPVFCQDATPEKQIIFQEKANYLNLSLEHHNLKGLKPVAVIVLNSNLFGLDLKMVREFTDIRQLTPIPCCPVHIIGNMNLRGEILTLIDIRGLLNLPLTGITDASKAMVVEVEGIVAGVIVEEVCDVMFFLNPLEIMAVPTAIHSTNDEYLQGVTPYHEKMMSILDLPKILLNGGLSVDNAKV